jgi:hypothetical protein
MKKTNVTLECPHCGGINGEHLSEMGDIHFWHMTWRMLAHLKPKTYLNETFRHGYERCINDIEKYLKRNQSNPYDK